MNVDVREALKHAAKAINIPMGGRLEPEWLNDEFLARLEKLGLDTQEERVVGYVQGWLACEAKVDSEGPTR